MTEAKGASKFLDLRALEMTDVARLSRLHWEDCLRFNVEHSVVIYFKNDRDVLQSFNDVPANAAKFQLASTIAGLSQR